jgi:Ca2+/Na+ antiporter
MELFQILTGMNTVFLGLTVFAWAGSVGDYLTIVHFARTGNPQTAVAGVFPGQLFNYYIGFSISLIIQSFAHGG